MSATDRPSLATVLEQAVAQGLLPPAAGAPPPDDGRPWPVVLLTALGAWLAAVPLFGVVALLLGPLMHNGLGVYFCAISGIGTGLYLLRIAQRSAFVEQLAVPALLVGFAALGYGWARDLGSAPAAALLGLATLACAWAVLPRGLRVLLGAASALLLMAAVALAGGSGAAEWNPAALRHWLACHLALAAWVALLGVQARSARSAVAAWLEEAGAGWLLAVVAALAWLSGMSLLAGAFTGIDAPRPEAGPGPADVLMRGGSVLLAGAAALHLVRSWTTLRQAPVVAVAAALAGLAAFMPALGALAFAASLCLSTGRVKRATAAATAMAWVLGAFYYGLRWPLAQKALVLGLAGIVLGLAAGWLWRGLRTAGAPGAAAAAHRGRRAWLLPAGAAAIVAVSAWAIHQKEQLIAQGRPAFIELAPVDPRSLMQGDYMALNWKMADGLREPLSRLESSARPRVAARRDARQVLTLERLLEPGELLRPGEEAVELSPKGGRWLVVTDAWFFREGDAERWARARYGEFRLLPDGRALLVGLRGPALEAL